MDISQTYLEISKNKGINVCFSLIEDCPYKDNTFDLIICTDVLEHVIDMNIAVQNMLRVLKKGGVLILRVPYRENLKDYVENNTYEFVHLRNFDEYELQLMFTKIFPSTIIDVKKAGYDSFVLRILRQKIKSRFLISITKFVYRKLSNIFPENLLFNYVEINMVVKK